MRPQTAFTYSNVFVANTPNLSYTSVGNLAIWQSGNPAIWQSGNLAPRQSDIPAIWQPGNLAIRQFGNLAIWQPGNLAVQQCGNLAIWQSSNLAIWQSANLAIWQSANLAIWYGHSARPPGDPARPRHPRDTQSHVGTKNIDFSLVFQAKTVQHYQPALAGYPPPGPKKPLGPQSDKLFGEFFNEVYQRLNPFYEYA